MSDLWQIVYGLDIPGEEIFCDGCIEPDKNNPRRIGKEFPIRTCVLEKKITHYGKCGTFSCDLMERHLLSVEPVPPKAREILTPSEFNEFIDPYLYREFLSGSAKRRQAE